MATLRSIRFCSRARPIERARRTSSQRGFALAIALVLAVLYLGLIELLLIDSSRELAAARRFRARIVAQTMAENAAELAARNMVSLGPALMAQDDYEDEQGKMVGKLKKSDPKFELEGVGETAGLVKVKATVSVIGRIEGSRVLIDFTMHSQ